MRGDNKNVPYPRVKRCFPGEWKKTRGDAFCPESGGRGLKCLFYKKNYTTTEMKTTFVTDHECGKTCPSVPWERAIDSQDKLIEFCRSWK